MPGTRKGCRAWRSPRSIGIPSGGTLLTPRIPKNNSSGETMSPKNKKPVQKAPENPTRARVDWHQYFMNIAREVSTRSTCDRKHVGAVIVRDKTILSTGYNGSIRGMPHCDDEGHLMEDDHCVATIHA